MIDIKQAIQINFNQASQYDYYAHVQHDCGKRLIHSLNLHIKKSDMVLDIGCGSGYTTEQLIKYHSVNQLTLLDLSKSLLAQAKNRLNEHKPITLLQDFDQINGSEDFHLIFSNMALQWSTDLQTLLKKIHNNIKPNGYLAFSLPIEGSFSRVNKDQRHQFYSAEKINTFLVQTGLEVKHSTSYKALDHYPSNRLLLTALKKMGTHTKTKNKVARKKTDWRNTHDGYYTLDYKLGIFIAKRSDS